MALVFSRWIPRTGINSLLFANLVAFAIARAVVMFIVALAD
jgi:hypothetical protein